MENQTVSAIAPQQAELFVKMVLSAWETYLTRINRFLETVTDEQLLSETAPGRNRGIYLLGHLTAVSDGMLPLLDMGARMHPELDSIFITNPDQSQEIKHSISELKLLWNEVNTKLVASMHQLQPADWFARHTAVSEENFSKEPMRNKLNLVMNRTSHLSYHLGQLIYLQKK